MNRSMPALIAMLMTIVPLSVACAETYTVDGVRGDDANDGIAAPFRTIARGAAAVGPGDTLVLVPMDEPYRETMSLRRHGLPGAPITIEGGGAVLSGSDPAPAEGWQEGEGGVWSVPLAAHDRMMVFGPERHFFKGRSATELQPEQWFWAGGTFYFRPAEGRRPNDYGLLLASMAGRPSGIATSGAGWIIVRDLTCINFWNDGFNLHGGTGPMWFENITGNWNGDEGFSAHENAESYVRGGEFAHNYWHGITDIIFSRTHFAGVVCRDNRAAGVLFYGGMHSLTDCEISGSPINVGLMPASPNQFPLGDRHLLASGLTNLRNVVVRSADDEVGVQVASGAGCVIEHSLVEGGSPVIDVQPGGTAFVVNSVVRGNGEREVVADGGYLADHNVYFPGRFLIAGADYGPEQFADYRTATGNDANSVIGEPAFDESGVHLVQGSPGYAGADSGSYGGINVGPEDRTQVVSVAVAGATVLDTPSEPLEGGGRRYSYDFETDNPWSRIYPVPEQSEGGIAVTGTSELSDEQAHGGEHSARLHVVTPEPPPGAYNIKLFSQYLPYDRPVRRISYWLCGDGSGRSARLRIRDGGGEVFYDRPVTVDWTGWQQIVWDLDERAPVTGGGEDGLQNGPTMELVVEISMNAASEMTLYFDDLVVDLARDGWQQPAVGGGQAAAPAPEQPQAQPPTVEVPQEFMALELPEPDAPAPEGVAEGLPTGGVRYSWDFEATNPWNRIYPVPEQNQAGQAVGGVADLSEAQAHSGERSGRVLVQVPPAPPGEVQVKLFSARFQFMDRPISRIAFWVYNDGGPITYRLRVRDNRGEGFWGAPGRLDGSGWQLVAWDLKADPPATVRGGDENGVQNGPPLEVVLEYDLPAAAGWTTRTIYVDDLEVELAP